MAVVVTLLCASDILQVRLAVSGVRGGQHAGRAGAVHPAGLRQLHKRRHLSGTLHGARP